MLWGMDFLKKLRVTMYVKGVKTLVGEEDRSQWGYVVQTRSAGPYGAIEPGVYPDLKVHKELVYKSVLPEDQKAVVELVRAAAEKYGFELEVIDANKENLVQQIEDKIRHIDAFPTLISSTGEKIEGNITEERIKALVSKLSTA
jgi:hypothetical protein